MVSSATVAILVSISHVEILGLSRPYYGMQTTYLAGRQCMSKENFFIAMGTKNETSTLEAILCGYQNNSYFNSKEPASLYSLK